MRLATLFFLTIILCGCPTVYEKEKGNLKNDIEILKLEVRKQRLENELKDLERQK